MLILCQCLGALDGFLARSLQTLLVGLAPQAFFQLEGGINQLTPLLLGMTAVVVTRDMCIPIVDILIKDYQEVGILLGQFQQGVIEFFRKIRLAEFCLPNLVKSEP